MNVVVEVGAGCGAHAKYCWTLVTTTGCQTTWCWPASCAVTGAATWAKVDLDVLLHILDDEATGTAGAVCTVATGVADACSEGTCTGKLHDARRTTCKPASSRGDTLAGDNSAVPRCNWRLPKERRGVTCCKDPTEEAAGLQTPSKPQLSGMPTIPLPEVTTLAPSRRLMLPREDCCGVNVEPADQSMDVREAATERPHEVEIGVAGPLGIARSHIGVLPNEAHDELPGWTSVTSWAGPTAMGACLAACSKFLIALLNDDSNAQAPTSATCSPAKRCSISRTALQISAISWATSGCMPVGGQADEHGKVGVTILLGLASACSSGEDDLCAIAVAVLSSCCVKWLNSRSNTALLSNAASAMREQFESSRSPAKSVEADEGVR